MIRFRAVLFLAVAITAGVVFAQGPSHGTRGELLSVGDHSLHLYCSGEGSPTVLFEAGLGDGAINFQSLQSRVARFTRACVYDRAGYGSSEPGPLPRDMAALVTDLEALLSAAEEPGPFVLAGHSFGGVVTLDFANRNPASVSGVLLIDSSHPDQLTALQAVPEVVAVQDMEIAGLTDLVDAAEAGLLPVEAVLPAAPAALSPGARQAWAEAFVTPKQLRATTAEYDSLEASFAEAASHVDIGEIPLIVLSRGVGLEGQLPSEALEVLGLTPDVLARFDAAWDALQADLTTLSTNSKRVVAERSTHYVYFDQPALVEAAIRELVREARAGVALR